MKRLIFIVGFVAWFLVGCYDDKGNYDYKVIIPYIFTVFILFEFVYK